MADETETEARYAPEWWERTSGVAVDSKAAEGLADFQQMRTARMRISLSDGQRRQIAGAAASLASAAREVFISDVTATIETRCGGKVPSDMDVNVAISSVLSASPFWPRSSSSLRQQHKGGNDDQIRSTR